MAVVAAELFMRACEPETRAYVMVENPVVPRVRVVAQLAMGAEPSFVHIVTAVAVVAHGRGIAVDRAQVAFLAGCRRVHADQRKTAEVVVEHHAVAPAIFVVTVVAAHTLPAFVCVILAMAGITRAFELVRAQIALVTGGASGSRVFAAQREVGLAVMVEQGFFP